MRRFFVLFRKEVKELATLQALIPFVLVIAVFALIGNLVGSQGAEAEAARAIAIADLDRSTTSELVAEAARAAGFTVQLTAETDPAKALADPEGPSALIVVPAGFGASLASGVRAEVDTYAAIRNFSIMGSLDAEAIAGAGAVLTQSLQRRLVVANAPSLDPDVALMPVEIRPHVIVGDRQAATSPEVVSGFITTQTTFVPIVLFIVVVFAAQMVATALASEKENKTLESLLAMPVSRSAIAIAKMLAAGLLALASAGAYMIGIRYYINGLTEGFGGQAAADAAAQSGRVAAELGLTLSTTDYVLLGLSLFFAILVALAIALILGAFAENVKAVQSLLGPLMVALMVPYFLSMFVDVSALPQAARIAVLAVPFSHPFLAAPNLFLDNTDVVVQGIVYQAVWFVALVFIVGRIFRSDRLLTMRLNLSRKRGRAGADR